jgi:hypothetical protein
MPAILALMINKMLINAYHTGVDCDEVFPGILLGNGATVKKKARVFFHNCDNFSTCKRFGTIEKINRGRVLQKILLYSMGQQELGDSFQ